MEAEARAFGRRRQGAILGAHEFVLTVSGPGRENAARSAHDLIVDGCSGLLSCGYAGGLDPTFACGDIFLGDQVLTEAADELPIDAALRAELETRLGDIRAHRGAVLTVARAATSAREKHALRKRYGATAVDMESSAIAYVARSARVPFVIMRCIIDPLDFDIPAAALAGLDGTGQLRPEAVLQSIWSNPRQLPGLLRLLAHYRTARSALHAAARALR